MFAKRVVISVRFRVRDITTVNAITMTNIINYFSQHDCEGIDCRRCMNMPLRTYSTVSYIKLADDQFWGIFTINHSVAVLDLHILLSWWSRHSDCEGIDCRRCMDMPTTDLEHYFLHQASWWSIFGHLHYKSFSCSLSVLPHSLFQNRSGLQFTSKCTTCSCQFTCFGWSS